MSREMLKGGALPGLCAAAVAVLALLMPLLMKLEIAKPDGPRAPACTASLDPFPLESTTLDSKRMP